MQDPTGMMQLSYHRTKERNHTYGGESLEVLRLFSSDIQQYGKEDHVLRKEHKLRTRYKNFQASRWWEERTGEE